MQSKLSYLLLFLKKSSLIKESRDLSLLIKESGWDWKEQGKLNPNRPIKEIIKSTPSKKEEKEVQKPNMSDSWLEEPEYESWNENDKYKYEEQTEELTDSAEKKDDIDPSLLRALVQQFKINSSSVMWLFTSTEKGKESKDTYEDQFLPYAEPLAKEIPFDFIMAYKFLKDPIKKEKLDKAKNSAISEIKNYTYEKFIKEQEGKGLRLGACLAEEIIKLGPDFDYLLFENKKLLNELIEKNPSELVWAFQNYYIEIKLPESYMIKLIEIEPVKIYRTMKKMPSNEKLLAIAKDNIKKQNPLYALNHFCSSKEEFINLTTNMVEVQPAEFLNEFRYISNMAEKYLTEDISRVEFLKSLREYAEKNVYDNISF